MNSSGESWLQWSCRAVCGLSLLCSMGGMANAANSARDRFLTEAPQKWLEYRRIVSRHTEGTFKNHFTFHIGTEVLTDSAEGAFTLNSDCQGARLITQKEADVCNPNYSFYLKGGDGKWTISNLTMNSKWSMPDDFIGRDRGKSIVKGENSYFGDVMGTACAGQMLWGGWFPLMVSSPVFRLVEVTELPGEKDLVRVEFEFEPTGLTGGNAPARSGAVVLDATRYWLIHQAETKASGTYGEGSLRITNEFTDDKLSVPFVSRCVLQVLIPRSSQFDGKRYEGEFILNTDMHDAPNSDKKQFMLTAFGMPEPDYARPSRKRLWLALSCSLFLFFCFLLLMRHRRQQTSATPEV